MIDKPLSGYYIAYSIHHKPNIHNLSYNHKVNIQNETKLFLELVLQNSKSTV